MNTYPYTDTVPAANNAPKNDQPDMLQNTGSVAGIIQEDHIGFQIANGGYHKVVHQMGSGSSVQSPNLTRSGNNAVYANVPATIANVNQFLTGIYTPGASVSTADTQLFSVSGTGVVSQLTGAQTVASDLSEGWQWVGSVLIQWGTVMFSGGSSNETGTVTFINRIPGAIRFPAYTFSVQATLFALNNGVTTNSNTLSIHAIDRTGFKWVFNSSSSSGSTTQPGFTWIAIGN